MEGSGPAATDGSPARAARPGWRAVCAQRNPRGRRRRIACLAVGACLLPLAAVRADTPWEVWPEATYYYGLTPAARLYFDASYTKGLESQKTSLNLSAAYDVSIRPILRKRLGTLDWERNRYFWARFGYSHIQNATDGTHTDAEQRAVIALYTRAPLPANTWLEIRTRADLRWIGGQYSDRYRIRLQASREIEVREHAFAPYVNVEWFYDTRYDGWARTSYEVGSEATVSTHFRYELYLLRQDEHLPKTSDLNGVGIKVKWYY
jgi:hypothetical protein